MSKAMDAAIRGALGGLARGIAMYGMKQMVAPKVIPREMRIAGFAPRKSVEWVEEQVGHSDALTGSQEEKAAMGAHLAYSAAFGALYGAVRRRADGVPAPLAGVLFGPAVWKASLDGWMPALGIMPATTDLPMRKWPPDIMGRVVYGAATAIAHEALWRV